MRKCTEVYGVMLNFLSSEPRFGAGKTPRTENYLTNSVQLYVFVRRKGNADIFKQDFYIVDSHIKVICCTLNNSV